MQQRKQRLFNILLACVFFLLAIMQGGMFPYSFDRIQTLCEDDVGVVADNTAVSEGDESDDNEIKIEFYPLMLDVNNNWSQVGPGDSFIIAVGDTQILVDAGSTATSGAAIVSKMKSYLGENDKCWDYVIATHPDYDHLAAFAGSKEGDNNITNQRVFDTMFLSGEYTLGTLIDFDISQDEDARGGYDSYSKLYLDKAGQEMQSYANYRTAREKLISKKIVSSYSPVSKLCENQRKYVEKNKDNPQYEELWKNRATPIPLSKDGKITLNFLYNYHNDHREAGEILPADINNLSVCFTIDYQKSSGEIERFLFTGDLEEFDSSKKVTGEVRGVKRIFGESNLVKYNPWLKEGVIFYKAAHHGSYTSSSDALMDAIRPKNVVIPAIAGGHYNFPHQEAIDSMYRYTDNIAITGLRLSDAINADYYGTINISYKDEQFSMEAGNKSEVYSNGKLLPLHETAWFKANRKTPCHVFTFSGQDIDSDVTAKGNCSLVKYGDTEILVDCGVWANTDRIAFSNIFLDKIKKHCSDGVIEYVLVSSSLVDDMKQLIDTGKDDAVKGLFHTFQINNVITFEEYMDNKSDDEYGKYCATLRELKGQGTNVYVATSLASAVKVNDQLSIDVLKAGQSFCGYSVCYEKQDMIFPTALSEEQIEKQKAAKGNKEGDEVLFKDLNIVYMRVPKYGALSMLSESILQNFYERNKNLYLAVNGIAEGDSDAYGKTLTKAFCDMLQRCSAQVFLSMGTVDGVTKEYAGDIIFTIGYGQGEATYDFCGFANGTGNATSIFYSEYYQQARG